MADMILVGFDLPVLGDYISAKIGTHRGTLVSILRSVLLNLKQYNTNHCQPPGYRMFEPAPGQSQRTLVIAMSTHDPRSEKPNCPAIIYSLERYNDKFEGLSSTLIVEAYQTQN